MNRKTIANILIAFGLANILFWIFFIFFVIATQGGLFQGDYSMLLAFLFAGIGIYMFSKGNKMKKDRK